MDIGWVGTGVMGSSMAGHLQSGGHNLSVFNRTREKAAGLLEKGATWRHSPSEVARNAEIFFEKRPPCPEIKPTLFGQEWRRMNPLSGKLET